jgi:phospholipid/cholesterol/gamma-HCH transport system permease protein
MVARSPFTQRIAAAGGVLDEAGDMMILAGQTIVSAVRTPHPYGGEFVNQFLFALRLCWLPLAITALTISYAVPGVQGANFLQIIGGLDRLGSIYVVAVVREFSPLVCSIIVSGVAGTAITADLGARKIREELDALQVLGVDPVKNLVVPRFLALMIVTALFDVFAIFFGLCGGVIATLTHGAPVGPFLVTFFSNASTTEIWASLLKCTLFGAITAIVCCYKGMTASGGAEGVGRAVNQAVVMTLMLVASFNYIFTQTVLATHPEITVIR